MTIFIISLTLLYSATFNPILGIDNIKKINSLDVENLRADPRSLTKMEGHGSVIQYLPQVNSPFYTPLPSNPLHKKEYPEPWRQPRPKVLQTPIPGGATAATNNESEQETPEKKNDQRLLFEDIFEQTRPKSQQPDNDD